MAILQEYAQLSSRVYSRTDANRTPVPAGWTELRYIGNDRPSGFSGGVYRNQGSNEIVIAFTGTNESMVWDFAVANIPAGFSDPSVQVSEAMLLYLEVKRENPDANITFTGHSLGGGLASLMAVFFNEPATVFDQAPFELTAVTIETLLFYRAQLAHLGYTDATFDEYINDFFSLYPQREANVAAVYLEGEILAAVRAIWPEIQGSETMIPVGEQTYLEGLSGISINKVDVHSMSLLTAMLVSPSFASMVQSTSTALELFFDTSLYKTNPEVSPTASFLERLLIAQLGIPAQSVAPVPLLDRFAADVLRLRTGDGGATASPAIQRGLIATIMEYYYFVPPGDTDPFVTLGSNGAVLDLSRIDPSSNGRGQRRLLAGLEGQLDEAVRPRAIDSAVDATVWTVQVGANQLYTPGRDENEVQIGGATQSNDLHGGGGNDLLVDGSGASTLEGGSGNDVLVGNAGDDLLYGGSQADYLAGGGGNDSLIGGTGSDELYGGVGSDNYNFFYGDGSDVVVDSDGSGAIFVEGVQLAIGERIAENIWRSTDGALTIERQPYGGHQAPSLYSLVIRDATGSLVITVRDWQMNQLGINLTFGSYPDAGETTGDVVPLSGGGTEWPPPQPTSSGTGQVRSFLDYDNLFGSASADRIFGLGGNDALVGRGGDDYLEAGDGRDLLLGGAGRDTLIGGAGGDVLIGDRDNVSLGNLIGTQYGEVYLATAATDFHGLGWGMELYGTVGPITNHLFSGISTGYVGGDADMIDAGAGDDHVMSGDGDDVVSGGDGNDEILAEAGDDNVQGGAGNDVIIGDGQRSDVNPNTIIIYSTITQQGRDVLHGGDDDDYIAGGGNADLLYGDGGNDQLYGDTTDEFVVQPSDHGDDLLDGGAGNDFLTGQGGNDSLYGGEDADVIRGDADDLAGQYHGADLLSGGAGDDQLKGGGGADQLFGGAGNDLLVGDADSSELDAAFHRNDYLDGGADDDQLIGGGGSDRLLGGSGNDRLFGDQGVPGLDAVAQGADHLDGGTGDDELAGGGGADTLLGGDGIDHIEGDDIEGRTPASAHGDDYIDAGAGDDVVFGWGGADTIVGGEGADQLVGDATSLDAQYHGNDHIAGGGGNDALLGLGGNDQLLGGDGNDILDGDSSGTPALTGNDYLAGGAGADTLLGGGGSDTLLGGTGADELFGDSSDTPDALHGNDYLDGGTGDDLLAGAGGADTLIGGDGADTLDGDGGGISVTIHGDDYLDGGAGVDTLIGSGGSDTLLGGSGSDQLYGDASGLPQSAMGNDTLDGGEGDDLLIGGGGSDTLLGGSGNDQLAGDASDTPVTAQDGDALDGGAGNDILYGFGGNDSLLGGSDDDMLSGGDGNDSLDGGTGVDELSGGAGDDTLLGGAGDDNLYGGEGDDYLDGGEGVDYLSGGGGEDTLAGGAGADTYSYSLGSGRLNIVDAGTNTLSFNFAFASSGLTLGIGSLRLTFAGSPGDEIHIEGFDPNDPTGSMVIDRFVFTDRVMTYSEILALGFDLQGTPDVDFIEGTSLDDRINALASDDTVVAGAGNDMIDGGAGADAMMGGTGNDAYVVESSGDIVTELANEGTDGVSASITYTLTANVENLTLTGAAAINATGNTLDNHIIGNDADNTLDGGAGADLLEGGAGNDRYIVDNVDDQILESANSGVDSVESSVTYDLDNGVENLTLTGAVNIDGFGNSLDNVVTGNAGNNLLDGGGGLDTLQGGAGDDTYLVDGVDDVVAESADAGTDTIRTAISYTLGENVENLLLTGGAAVNGTGNSLSNLITGNAAANVLDGRGGADTLAGGEGADTYIVDDAGDVIVENGPEDFNDRVEASVSYTLSSQAQIETFVLTGTAAINVTGNAHGTTYFGNDAANTITDLAGNDSLFGNGGNDTLVAGDGSNLLDGGEGADRMEGGGGHDSYYVDDAGDVVVEAESGGDDFVNATVTHTLAANVENLRLAAGAGDINGTGNALSNTILGNEGANTLIGLDGGDTLIAGAGNDTLDGGSVADVLSGGEGDDILIGGDGDDDLTDWAGQNWFSGGAGNDRYRIGTTTATIIEDASGGIDTVHSFSSHVLGANLENLVIDNSATGDEMDGTGNELANAIEGNDLTNILRGLGGDDTLDGRSGNDSLYGGTGADSLYGGDAVVDWVSGEDGNLVYIGFMNNDLLSGEEGDDSLDGGDGNDELFGGSGGDVLYGGDDRFVEGSGGYGGGYGGFLSNDDYLDGGEGDDDLDGGSGSDELHGGAGVDILYGGDNGLLNTTNDDVLDGGAGIDTMSGGTGSDTYYVDGTFVDVPDPDAVDECGVPIAGATRRVWTTDTIIENANAGYDRVYSAASIVLPENFEEVILTGTEALDATAGAGDQTLHGNSANNRLDGGSGVDVMIGGAGNDTLVVDSIEDFVEELAGEGVDTIESSITYTLGANLENLTLTGASNLDGAGNSGANVLRGNAGNNLLSGLSGNDELNGGAGNDTLEGGAGDDVYRFGVGSGVDTVSDLQGLNSVRLLGDLRGEDLTLTRSGDDLILTINGNSSDRLVLLGWNTIPSLASGNIRLCDCGCPVNLNPPVAVADTANVVEDVTLAASGSVLANDSDADVGASLSVTDARTVVGAFGTLVLAADGTYTFTLDNSFVQSLGQGQTLSQVFGYTISDNQGNDPRTASAALTVTVTGTNDAPVLVTPIADRQTQEGQALSFSVPAGTFTDIDQNDVLSYTATLADGSALPSWLTFDPVTRQFAGTAGTAGTYAVRVVATDLFGASASDVFEITVAAGEDDDDTLPFVPTDTWPVGTPKTRGGATIWNRNRSLTIYDGGAGTDTLLGTSGADAILLDSNLDVGVPATTPAHLVGIEVIDAGAGDDVVDMTSPLYSYGPITVLGGAGNDILIGGTAADVLNGGDGDDSLEGRGGADTLIGGTGNDRFVVGDASDVIVEDAAGGTNDYVDASVSYTLHENIEHLFLMGSSDINGTGNSGNNSVFGNDGINVLDGAGGDDHLRGLGGNDELRGGAGNDTLRGGAGADLMIGGTGNDYYTVDDDGDVVVEAAGEGGDIVEADRSYVLQDNVEFLVLTGSANINGTGNGANNNLYGNDGNNVLDGAGGDDWIKAYAGDDELRGGAGNDLLQGGAGSDVMIGGAGDDLYYVEDAGDVVVEAADGGVDGIDSASSIVLQEHIERLFLSGSGNINGTGNTANNSMFGNDGNNVLDGAGGDDWIRGYAGDDELRGGAGNDVLRGDAGSDLMVGGTGDDIYYVEDAGDVVVEAADGGIDGIDSTSSHVLQEHVERLFLSGSGNINGTGNNANNSLFGTNGNNVLDGAGGDDYLRGYAGDDVYYVDSQGDFIQEFAGEGTDAIHSSVSTTLADQVEVLFLSGTSALNGTGNALNNLLRGNDGANVLTGGAGIDILEGSAGADTLSDSAGNTIFSGGAGNDSITATAANDLLAGGAGDDTIETGGGSDVIVFNRGDGNDLVRASTGADHTLSLGDGIAYADLLFARSGDDLIVITGASEQVTLEDWYVSPANRSVDTLQIMIEGTADYDAGSSDATRNRRVQAFDFSDLVDAFDAARAANPGLSSWALTNALTTFHLGGSDTAAIGGDLAYQYGTSGSLANIGLVPAQDVIGSPQFGGAAQLLRPIAELHVGAVRLS